MEQESMGTRLRETLALFPEDGTPLTTSDVASQVDVGHRSTYNWLRRLVDEGWLQTKHVGAHARVWWRPRHRHVTSLSERAEPMTAAEAHGDKNRDESTSVDRSRLDARVAALGRHAVEDWSFDEVLHEAAALGAEALGGDRGIVWRLDDEGSTLRLVCAVGLDDELVGTARRVDDEPHLRQTLASTTPVVTDTLDRETRLPFLDWVGDEESRAVVTTAIGTPDERWGVLAVPTGDPTAVTDEALGVVRSMTTVLSTAASRQRQQQELAEVRRSLATVEALHTVVHDVTNAVLNQSTRTAIEAAVCDRLVTVGSYRRAWVGEIDDDAGVIRPRYVAGDDAGTDGDGEYTVSLSADEAGPETATAQAVDRGVVTVVETPRPTRSGRESSDVASDSAADTARSSVSTVAIPITHDGTRYGILTVDAERPDGVSERERAVLGQLGAVVAHAISAAERKQALVSDELVEVVVQVDGVYDQLETAIEPAGTYTFDHSVPIGDGDFIVYGTASTDAIPHLEDLVTVNPMWESIRFVDEGDPAQFELQGVDLPVFSAVAARGGLLESVVVHDGDLQFTILFASTVDIAGVIETIKEHYPHPELRRQRQFTRTVGDTQRVQHRIQSTLTDRQQTALAAAFHAGYFEWPRRATAQDVAASIGIAPSTFHQHLRKAQRKVFESIYTDSLVDAD